MKISWWATRNCWKKSITVNGKQRWKYYKFPNTQKGKEQAIQAYLRDKLELTGEKERQKLFVFARAEIQKVQRYLEEYDSKSWNGPKTVVVKTEVTAFSSSQRAVITNVPDAAKDPRKTYLDYAMRGESENRNKELKCDLCADRLSDHRFMANMFRVLLHCMAHNLVVMLRQLVALQTPLPVVGLNETQSDLAVPRSSDSSTDVSGKLSIDGAAANVGVHTRLHDESDHTRRRRHNERHGRNNGH